MVVHSRDDCIVMAIPRHHGDFGFEVAFLFAHCLNSEQKQRAKKIQLETYCMVHLLKIIQNIDGFFGTIVKR